MTDENFPSRTVCAETRVQLLFAPENVSEIPATVRCMTERQVGDEPKVLTPVRGPDLVPFPDLTDAVAARIEQSMASARSAGTRRAYASAWRRFDTWCTLRNHQSLPAHPATVAAYLVDAADTLTPDGSKAYAPSTFGKWVAAIADRHRSTGRDNPCSHEMVTATLRRYTEGLCRSGGAAPQSPRPAADRRHHRHRRSRSEHDHRLGIGSDRTPRHRLTADRLRRGVPAQ